MILINTGDHVTCLLLILTHHHFFLLQNQISGYLLRKYKNSSGWQRLWTVLSSLCLFFYKSYQDEAAIASISLLGYGLDIDYTI